MPLVTLLKLLLLLLFYTSSEIHHVMQKLNSDFSLLKFLLKVIVIRSSYLNFVVLLLLEAPNDVLILIIQVVCGLRGTGFFWGSLNTTWPLLYLWIFSTIPSETITSQLWIISVLDVLKRVAVTIKCMATERILKEEYVIGSKVHLYMISIMIFGIGQEQMCR